MATKPRDVLVIGGSAGAIEALKIVLNSLPADLGAAVAVTLHRHPTFASSLAAIFATHSKLEVIEPHDGATFAAGRVYLAPQDRHMLIDKDVIRLDRGPRQHHTRPAIDPMFVSAANSAPGRVIGLLLTGNLSDGVSGLIHIKGVGGLSLVQDPRDAAYPSMPRNALIYDNVDLVLRVASMGQVVTKLVRGGAVSVAAQMPGARRPGSEESEEPHWVAPRHRLP